MNRNAHLAITMSRLILSLIPKNHLLPADLIGLQQGKSLVRTLQTGLQDKQTRRPDPPNILRKHLLPIEVVNLDELWVQVYLSTQSVALNVVENGLSVVHPSRRVHLDVPLSQVQEIVESTGEAPSVASYVFFHVSLLETVSRAPAPDAAPCFFSYVSHDPLSPTCSTTPLTSQPPMNLLENLAFLLSSPFQSVGLAA